MPIRPPTFRPKGARTRRETNVEYDARRGSARDRGYDARWDAVSVGFRRHNPLCLGCEAVGRVTPTALVDHIIPHKGDRALFWDPANRQPSCGPHHDVVKQRLEVLFAQGKAKRDDLKLDSEMAKALTLELLGS